MQQTIQCVGFEFHWWGWFRFVLLTSFPIHHFPFHKRFFDNSSPFSNIIHSYFIVIVLSCSCFHPFEWWTNNDDFLFWMSFRGVNFEIVISVCLFFISFFLGKWFLSTCFFLFQMNKKKRKKILLQTIYKILLIFCILFLNW